MSDLSQDYDPLSLIYDERGRQIPPEDPSYPEIYAAYMEYLCEQSSWEARTAPNDDFWD